MLKFFNRIISWSFYILFFLTPLAFLGDTSELFEFNKMWIVFALTTIIVASWICKMIAQRSIQIQRTPLDIPILLFLLSQIIATVFSLDPNTSLWGYYSRFNGGLFSILSYILLYYAFVSNSEKKQLIRYIWVSILSAIVVALWGLPSHFGYDPTCLIFRGTLDVSCWTFAFQPKVRIFSTMGQPDWLAAYLAIFIPVTLTLSIYFQKKGKQMLAILLSLTTLLFFVDLLFTKARSGILGFGASIVVLLIWYVWVHKHDFFSNMQTLYKKEWMLLASLVGFVIFSFFIGTSITQIDNFSFSALQNRFASQKTVSTSKQQAPVGPARNASQSDAGGEIGGTDSGKIRLFVWKGAIDAWFHNPIFGTGVETFAYAYYLYRPQGHNLTSEWDYLYNKAHNEYLNFLATTGIVGLGTYLAFIGLFLFLVGKKLLHASKEQQLEHMLSAGLLAGFVSILVTNFFGFSVVIVSLYTFLIPAFVFLLLDLLPDKQFTFPKPSAHTKGSVFQEVSGFGWLGISVVSIVMLFILYMLFAYWNADKSYGLGLNLDHAGQYQAAYQPLHDAVSGRPSEPTFQDELSLNDAILAGALVKTDPTNANKLAQEAVAVSTSIVTNHPNVVTFWKTRVRVLYSLAQLNPQVAPLILEAIQKAHALAPTDAKISYNYGLILGQTGSIDKAIPVLLQTIQLKPDYPDPYYALGLFYHQAAIDKSGKVVNQDLQQKAIDTMKYYLAHFADDPKVHDALKSWNAE